MENHKYLLDNNLLDHEDIEFIAEFLDEKNSSETKEMLALLVLSLRLIDCGLYSCEGVEQLKSLKAGHAALRDALGMLDDDLLREVDSAVVSALERKCNVSDKK